MIPSPVATMVPWRFDRCFPCLEHLGHWLQQVSLLPQPSPCRFWGAVLGAPKTCSAPSPAHHGWPGGISQVWGEFFSPRKEWVLYYDGTGPTSVGFIFERTHQTQNFTNGKYWQNQRTTPCGRLPKKSRPGVCVSVCVWTSCAFIHLGSHTTTPCIPVSQQKNIREKHITN